VNAKTTYQSTALMAACRNRHTAVVKVLIAANADLNAKDENGDTALDHAKRAGAQDIVSMLVQMGGTSGKQ
jgi:ankyrin repeat protein